MLKNVVFLLAFSLSIKLVAQDKGYFSGSFISSYQKFIKDDEIGANTKVYQENTNSLDAWMFLNYKIKGYTFIARYDGFFNSPLLNPISSLTQHGIGFWQINKKLDKLDITAGYFYDQLGSGLLFRSYELKPIGADYALLGARLQYDLTDNIKLRGFVGNQKGNINNRFTYAPQVISGVEILGENAIALNTKNSINVNWGVAGLNRSLTSNDMETLIGVVKSYPINERFKPLRNVYGGSLKAGLNYKNLNINAEYVVKSKEGIYVNQVLKNYGGTVLFGSIGYGKSNIKVGKHTLSFGTTLQGRLINKFVMRTSPTENLLNGLISYLPSVSRQNSYRLLARYTPATQDLGEDGVQMNVVFNIDKKTFFELDGSYIQTKKENGVNNKPQILFSEMYGSVEHKFSDYFKVKLGLQSVTYNQEVLEQERVYDTVVTFTPFAEIGIKGKKGKNLRIETQVLITKDDQGSFANLVLEYNFNSKISLALGNMINYAPNRYKDIPIKNKMLNYPSIFSSYNAGNVQYTLAFLKQQAGVNCSGGVCRVEPAFSGIRFTANAQF